MITHIYCIYFNEKTDTAREGPANNLVREGYNIAIQEVAIQKPPLLCHRCHTVLLPQTAKNNFCLKMFYEELFEIFRHIRN